MLARSKDHDNMRVDKICALFLRSISDVIWGEMGDGRMGDKDETRGMNEVLSSNELIMLIICFIWNIKDQYYLNMVNNAIDNHRIIQK